MAKQKILAVEDDKNISRLIVYNLEKAGFNCTAAMSGEEALAAVDKEEFDLIILDLMLPKIDGLEVCRILKQDKESQKIPVVMLTAKGEEVDRVVGLELGADDYIVKPFSPRELVLRIKAVLRRGEVKKEETPGVLTAEGISVDIERHKVVAQKKEVELTAMEFRLLVTLMERRGRVQSRDRLLEDVWGITSDIDTRTVDTHIKRLRSKLGRSGKFIRTLRNVGYKFEDNNEKKVGFKYFSCCRSICPFCRRGFFKNNSTGPGSTGFGFLRNFYNRRSRLSGAGIYCPAAGRGCEER